MDTPSPDELRMVAQFKVGDHVWTAYNGPCIVTARYWLRAKGCIGYDLEFHYNRVQLHKMEEHLLYTSRQHDGTLMGAGGKR